MASVFRRALGGFRNAPVGLRPAKPFAQRFYTLAAIDERKLRLRAEQITQLAASRGPDYMSDPTMQKWIREHEQLLQFNAMNQAVLSRDLTRKPSAAELIVQGSGDSYATNFSCRRLWALTSV